MKLQRNPVAIVVAVALAALGSGAAQAQATLNQAKMGAWPYELSQPGHYKLTGNIVVPAGMPGFKITAPNVTLDLNGFTVGGPVTCTYSGGVTCSTALVATAIGVDVITDGAVVRGGTVQGFAGAGIQVSQGGARLIDLSVTQNAGTGIFFNTTSSTMVDRTHVTKNGVMGINCRNGHVDHSSIELNGAGVYALGCMVMDSKIRGNKGLGLSGSALVRGTWLLDNGGNKSGTIKSGGGNLDNWIAF